MYLYLSEHNWFSLFHFDPSTLYPTHSSQVCLRKSTINAIFWHFHKCNDCSCRVRRNHGLLPAVPLCLFVPITGHPDKQKLLKLCGEQNFLKTKCFVFPRTLWLERGTFAISEFITAFWLEKLAKKACQEKSLQLALFSFFSHPPLVHFFNCGCNNWIISYKTCLWWLSGFAVSDTLYIQSWIRDLKYIIPLPLFYTMLSVLFWYLSFWVFF